MVPARVVATIEGLVAGMVPIMVVGTEVDMVVEGIVPSIVVVPMGHAHS